MSVGTVLTLAAWLHAGPATGAEDFVIASALVDPAATRVAVEARVGVELASWKIEVSDAEDGAVIVRVRGREDSREEARTLPLHGDTAEERSRELAVAIALLIDEASDATIPHEPAPEPEPEPEPVPEPEPEPAPRPPAPTLRGWVAIGPRISMGPPRAVQIDGGVELTGGLSLLREHLQPLLLFGWTTTRANELSLQMLHLGVGVAGGAKIAADRLWIGAGVLPRVLWVQATEGITEARIWNGAGDAFALGQFRAPLRAPLRPPSRKGSRAQLLASLRVGVDLSVPSIVVLGATATVRRGDVRGLVGASLGVIW